LKQWLSKTPSLIKHKVLRINSEDKTTVRNYDTRFFYLRLFIKLIVIIFCFEKKCIKFVGTLTSIIKNSSFGQNRGLEI